MPTHCVRFTELATEAIRRHQTLGVPLAGAIAQAIERAVAEHAAPLVVLPEIPPSWTMVRRAALLLAKRGGMTPTHAAQALGSRANVVWRAMRKLRRLGYATSADGTYRITPKALRGIPS